MQSVGQKKTKTLRKRFNATITRVLNMSGDNYKINLNRKSEISYKSFTLTDHQEVSYRPMIKEKTPFFIFTKTPPGLKSTKQKKQKKVMIRSGETLVGDFRLAI